MDEYSASIRELFQKILDNRTKNIGETIRYCDEMIAEGEAEQDAKLLGIGCYYKGEAFYYLNEGGGLLEYMTRALSYLKAAEEWLLLTKCYNFLAIVSVNCGNIPYALDCYLNGLEYCRRCGFRDMEAIFNINIGSLNLLCEKYDVGQKYYELAVGNIGANREEARYHSLMHCSYVNLSKCLVFQGKYKDAESCFEKIRAEHSAFVGDGERLTFLCVVAIYYQRLGMAGKRDACIAEVNRIAAGNITVMDVFDDFYDYCRMLMEAGLDEQFWLTLKNLDPMIESSQIINLRLRMASLKMMYYRKNGMDEEYGRTAVVYYELSKQMEAENRNMIYCMLNTRTSLETLKRQRRKIEAENRRLAERSERDPLTGLGNRFRLNSFSEQALQRAYYEGTSLTVEILDVDYFKEYNDNYGHQAGDACLTAVAEVLRRMCGETGAFCARYGGDEFIVIYEGIDRAQACRYADMLKSRIMALQIEHRYSKAHPYVTVSQGLCCGVPVQEKKLWDFLHEADNVLYEVKNSGRNSYGVTGLPE